MRKELSCHYTSDVDFRAIWSSLSGSQFATLLLNHSRPYRYAGTTSSTLRFRSIYSMFFDIVLAYKMFTPQLWDASKGIKTSQVKHGTRRVPQILPKTLLSLAFNKTIRTKSIHKSILDPNVTLFVLPGVLTSHSLYHAGNRMQLVGQLLYMDLYYKLCKTFNAFMFKYCSVSGSALVNKLVKRHIGLVWYFGVSPVLLTLNDLLSVENEICCQSSWRSCLLPASLFFRILAVL